jgi:hypothetical protein
MLKFAVASVVLMLGFTVATRPALAAPREDDCVNCAPPKPSDNEDATRVKQQVERLRALEASSRASAGERAPNAGRPADVPAPDCANCPPPRNYDSTEVVKNSRDVDQSLVINTESVVHVPPRVKEHNKLIIHENETRNVGVIQHNHRIIEKEVRYVKRTPVYRYQAVPRVQTVLVPIAQPSCGCPCTCGGSYGAQAAYAQAYVYETTYTYRPARSAVQQVWVPVDASAGYGYR